MNGSYTPRTLPVGGEEAREVSPRTLAEALMVKKKLFLVHDYALFWNNSLNTDNGSRIIIQIGELSTGQLVYVAM